MSDRPKLWFCDTVPIASAVSVLLVVGAAAVIAIAPQSSAAFLGVPLVVAAASSASGRYLILVLGDLAVFRGSDQLDIPKVVYLAWVLITSLLAAMSLTPDRRLREVLGPLLGASLLVGIALLFSLGVALQTGIPILDWFRDAAPYGMVVVAPLLAWSGVHSIFASRVQHIAVATGIAAAFAFAVEWFGRRDLATLPLATLGSGSIMLAALGFSICVAATVAHVKHGIRWALAAALILGILLATGTRSTLIFLAAPVGMVLATAWQPRIALRALPRFIIVGLVSASLLLVVSNSGFVNSGKLWQRLDSVASIGSTLATDQSYQSRQYQAALATAAFEASPIFGVGLGYRFNVPRMGSQPTSVYTIDTGLSLMTKFGVVGVMLLGVSGLIGFVWVRQHRSRLSEHALLSVIGVVSIWCAELPFGNPLDDKGFALSLVLLGTWLLAEATQVGADRAGRRSGPVP